MTIKTIIHVSLVCSFISMHCMELIESDTNKITDTQLQKLVKHVNDSSFQIVNILRGTTKNFPLVPKTMSLFLNLDQEKIDDMLLTHVKDNELRPLLLAMGADIKVRNKKKRNCLWDIKNPELLKELIGQGAEVDVTDENKDTPVTSLLYYAHDLEDIAAADILLTHSTNPKMHFDNDKNLLCHTIEYRNENQTICLKIVQLLCKYGINVNAQDSIGFTPLIRAIEAGLTNIVEYLLQHNADANMCDNFNRYPIHYAMVEKNEDNYLQYSKKIIPKIVTLLLQHKADPNKPYPHCTTRPLHVAIAHIQPELIKELLNHGAEKHHLDVYRNTAYQLAQRYRYKQEILDLLYVEPPKHEKQDQNKIMTFSMTEFQEPQPINQQPAANCSIQ